MTHGQLATCTLLVLLTCVLMSSRGENAFTYIMQPPTYLSCNPTRHNTSLLCSVSGPANVEFKLVWLGAFHNGTPMYLAEQFTSIFSSHGRVTKRAALQVQDLSIMEHSFVWCQIVVTSPLSTLPPPSNMLALQDVNSYRSQPPCGQTLGIFTTDRSCAWRYQIRSCKRSLQDENMTQGDLGGGCRHTCAETASIAISGSLASAALVLGLVLTVYCKGKIWRHCKTERNTGQVNFRNQLSCPLSNPLTGSIQDPQVVINKEHLTLRRESQSTGRMSKISEEYIEMVLGEKLPERH